jgi:hypothetical protein
MVKKDAKLLLRQCKAALRVLLTMGVEGVADIKLNDVTYQYFVDESHHYGVGSMGNTHHYLVRNRETKKLYWFEQFAAIITPMHIYIEFCGLTNGDVCVGVWETRCNRPFHAVLIFRVTKGECELFTTHNFRHIFAGVELDPGLQFDMAAMEK